MKRSVVIRGKPVQLTTGKALAVRMAHGHLLPNRLRKRPSVDSPEVDRLRAAGWEIVPTTDDLILVARSRLRRPQFEEVREVHVAAGRILLTDDRLTVKLKEPTSDARAADLLRADGLLLLSSYPLPGVYEARTLAAESALDAAERLTANRRYQYAEPVFEELVGQRWSPAKSNTGYAKQWQWRNDGSFDGVVGADTHIEPAWDVTRGGAKGPMRAVRIAVIDAGMDTSNTDIAGAIVDGAYFEYVKNRPARLIRHVAGAWFPESGHGTACATLAVGREGGDNGCGAAPEAELIPIACLSGELSTQGSIAQALLHAAFPREQLSPAQLVAAPVPVAADLVSCSLGPEGPSWILTSVLDDALNRLATEGRDGLGMPIFWAVSNLKVPIDGDEIVTHAGVISVASTTRKDDSGDAAYGAGLDFTAPGIAVFTSVPGATLEPVSGTSFAAPIAAGIAALVLSQKPDLTATALRARMRSTCDRIGLVAAYDASGRSHVYGSGRLNAEKAVTPPS